MKIILVDIDGVLVSERSNQLQFSAINILKGLIEENQLLPVWCTGRNIPEDIFYGQIIQVIDEASSWPIMPQLNYCSKGWWKKENCKQWFLENQMKNISELWILDDDCLETENSLANYFGCNVKIISPDRNQGLLLKDIV